MLANSHKSTFYPFQSKTVSVLKLPVEAACASFVGVATINGFLQKKKPARRTSCDGDRGKAGTPLAAKPELELALILCLHFDWHQIHAGSLRGGVWPEINASAGFFPALSIFFFFGATYSSTSGEKRRCSRKVSY